MVSIQLTEMGEKFADETILHVFQYILLLKVRKFQKENVVSTMKKNP